MYRIDKASALAAKPAYPAGGVGGYFGNCNPNDGSGGTELDANWFNRVQEELCHVILGAGIALDPADDSQLYAAIQAIIASSQSAPPPFGRSARGVVIRNDPGTPASKISVSYDEAVMANAALSSGAKNVNGAFTINTAVVGLNGLDAGVMTNNNWYHVYGISDGDHHASILSLSSNAPASPAAYSRYVRLGAVRYGAGTLLQTVQRGRHTQYQSAPLMASGAATNSAVSVSAFVPPTASRIRMILSSTGGSAGQIGGQASVAPVLGGVGVLVGGSAATSGYVPSAAFADFVLDATSVYYTANSNAPAALYANGWEDSI